jgi:hypothetical protein
VAVEAAPTVATSTRYQRSAGKKARVGEVAESRTRRVVDVVLSRSTSGGDVPSEAWRTASWAGFRERDEHDEQDEHQPPKSRRRASRGINGIVRTVRVPTLVIAGSASPGFFHDAATRIARLLPKCSLSMRQGQDHGAPAHVVAPVVAEFLAAAPLAGR